MGYFGFLTLVYCVKMGYIRFDMLVQQVEIGVFALLC